MYVFVYGTLKRDCPNHYVLQKEENGTAEFIGVGKTVELFPLIVTTKYEIPFLLDKPGCGKKVQGEVYKIDEQMIEFLDKFEWNPEVYTRREVQIQMEGGKEIVAWLFVFHTFREELLKETFLEEYTCQNYDVLRSLSGKVEPEERKELLALLRD